MDIMKFDGPVFTVFTAFDAEDRLDIPATLKYVDFLLDSGVEQLYVMPYNSRYLQLSWDEISLLNTSVIKHVKSHGKASVIVSGPVECSTINTLKFADEAFEAGADCFASAFGEKYFSDDQVIKHYSALESLQKSILVHEQPLISGHGSKQMNWPMSLVEKVASLDGVIGFKEDTKSHEFGKMILERNLPAQMVFAGRKSLFSPLLKYGLSAYLNGISIVNPKLAFVFWKLAKEGDQTAVEKFVRLVDDPFWDGPVKKYGWHRVNKASLEYFGLMSRRDRMPLPHLNDDEYKELASFWDNHAEVMSDWI
jgi:4-hydroxy-tetrahydrodipicolinate synthase